MTKQIIFGCCLAAITATSAFSQKVYSLDASRVTTEVRSGYFNMGDPGPADKKILVNSRYITIGGKPAIPVMGELQYSRMPAARWQDEILKMKACGVTVIATYAFWNHHEEIEGLFDWSG
ncbi:MAG: beta-galactosidase, partial [Chitinophaga rupis]